MNYGSTYLGRGNSSFSKPSIFSIENQNQNHSMKLYDNPTRTLRLKSNTLFAFQNDYIYSNICNTYNEIDDDFLNSEWTNNSNFYASACEKSHIWLQNVNKDEILPQKQEEEESICSISSEIEKNLDFLNEIYEDDLNEAKLSLDELSEIENDCHQNLK